MGNCYEELANAIILQAVKDYRDSSKILEKGRKNYEAKAIKSDCVRFFKSGWFSILTNLDGEALLEKLEEEVSYDG